MEEVKETEEKVRKCKACGKQLLDEKLPFCLRCRLSGRNTAGHVGEVVVGLAIAAGGVAAAANNQNNNPKA